MEYREGFVKLSTESVFSMLVVEAPDFFKTSFLRVSIGIAGECLVVLAEYWKTQHL